MLSPKLDANEVRQVLRELKEIEPTAIKDLRADLRVDLKPIAQQVAEAIPRQAPLSGLRGERYGWKPGKGTTGFTPGKSRKNAQSLVSIRVNYGDSSGYPFGIWVAEFARQFRSERGRALIANLNNKKPMKGKGGRYAYSQFRLLRPDVLRIATEVLNKTASKINRKLL